MTPAEIETRRRIKLSIWAYAYEFKSHSLVDDFIYDMESYTVDLSVSTGNIVMDAWFICNFEPDTGMWIHKHPELGRIAELYGEHYLYSIKMPNPVRC